MTPDYLVCLEDGKKFKSLKRHLRTKYNIPEADPDGGGSSEEGYCHVSTAQSMLDQLESTMSSFRLMAFAVAGISLLVGGIGNMIDRLVQGSVTDFFATQFMDFPVFNVADIFVTLGVICVLICLIREGGEDRRG